MRICSIVFGGPEGMKTRRFLILTCIAIFVVSCAHAGKPLASGRGTRDEHVLALAIAWLMGAAPDSKWYAVEINGRQPSFSILNLIAETGLLPTGARLQDHGPFNEAETVELRVSGPLWTDPHDARVAISYAVQGAAPTQCTVVVRVTGDDYHSWLLRTPSDVECWPKPRGIGSESSEATEQAET
jgi:hypothetical protein